jgi:deazaflavin-dependent oxidoreductase (nitroreductase family)
MAPWLSRADLRFKDRRHSLSSLGTEFPLCYLTVRGRRSGEARTVPLLYVDDGERVALIGSNFGRKSHPAWALNLEAAGEAEISIDAVPRRVSARRATAEEIDRYWQRALELWPGYEGYRRRAGRELRMFVLEPHHSRGVTPPG